MLRIEQIEDKDALKQAALLLDRECDKLLKLNRVLAEENARLKGQDPSFVQLELTYLKEMIAARERALFGDKSERRQGDETTEALPDAGATTPRRGHGPKPQP